MIVIGENTYAARSRTEFECRRLGRDALKGKEKEVAAYEVLAALRRAGAARRRGASAARPDAVAATAPPRRARPHPRLAAAAAVRGGRGAAALDLLQACVRAAARSSSSTRRRSSSTRRAASPQQVAIYVQSLQAQIAAIARTLEVGRRRGEFAAARRAHPAAGQALERYVERHQRPSYYVSVRRRRRASGARSGVQLPEPADRAAAAGGLPAAACRARPMVSHPSSPPRSRSR